MTLVIRPFTVDDADQFGLVHVRAWQATYRGTMTDEFLDALDGAAWARRWREHVADGDHGRVDLVAELDGHVVGAVSSRSAPTETAPTTRPSSSATRSTRPGSPSATCSRHPRAHAAPSSA
ncbi:MAG: hypothetical protein AAGF02_09095, partial [Actinomycetota bacterium]